MTQDIFSSHLQRRAWGSTVIAVLAMVTGLGLVGAWVGLQTASPQPPTSNSVVSAADVFHNPARKPERDLRGDTERGAASLNRGPILDRSAPVTLVIPSIDVRSPIRSLGQAADGSLEVPAPGPHYDDAAWYKHSPTPGELGPAILLGHVDSAAHGPSVFFRLGELKSGDEISITRADGTVAIFVVDQVFRYSKEDFPTKHVYADLDHAGLRIVTCGGAFDAGAGHYLDNIVVFATMVRTTRQ